MPGRRERAGSLAARMVGGTLVIVMATVLVASVLAMAGVYRLERAQEDARLSAYRQMILDGVAARLTGADRAIEAAVAASKGRVGDAAGLRQAVLDASTADAEYFDLMLVADQAGRIVAAAPSLSAPAKVDTATLLAGRVVTDTTVFSWQGAGDPTGAGGVWVSQLFGRDGGYVLTGRLRSSLMSLLLDDISSDVDERSAVLVDPSGSVVAQGVHGPALSLTQVTFVADRGGPEQGTAAGVMSPTGAMTAYWGDLGMAPDLHWRALVAEPRVGPLMRTRSALLPSALTVILASLVALWATSVFASRVVGPLRSVETAARAVVGGGVARPLEVDRDDEIGRMAASFNAVTQRLHVLRELTHLLASSTRRDQVLDAALRATAHLLGSDTSAAVFLPDDTGQRLQIAARRGEPDLFDRDAVLVDGPSWPAQAFRSRQVFTFSDGIDREGPEAMAGEAGPTGLALPLATGIDAIGVLVVLSRSERTFTDAETEMLGTFSAQAAVAIDNSRLFEDERGARREAEALRRVAEELEATSDLAASLTSVASIAAELLDVSCAGIGFFDAKEVGGSGQGGEAVWSAEARSEAVLWEDVFRAEGVAPHAHEPLVIRESASDPRLAGSWTAQGGGAVLAVPLVRSGKRRGVMLLQCRDASRSFTRRHLALAGTIGREVSLALDNAHLLVEARDRAANLEKVFRISQAVSSSLQSTVVLNRVLDVVQRIFSAEAVSLMTYDEPAKRLVTAMARGITDREMLYLTAAPGEDVPGEVFSSASVTMLSDVTARTTPLTRLAAASGFGAMLAVPLLARGRSVGVLSVFSTEPAAFPAEDIELLQTFASQAALAIDTARLYGREHRVASVLQASILPDQLPAIPGVEAASVYRPSAAEGEIGGDYYDLFLAPDGRVVIAIADVAGKGVSAATKTSMIRYSLRGMVAAGLGPAATLRELNRMVGESGDASEIVTIWMGMLDRGAGTLRYADAGHPAGLVLRDGEPEVESLGPTGPLLGGVPGIEYRESEVAFPPGSVILLYTDGVTEARRGRLFFGEGRIRRVLRGTGSAADVAERLMVAVDRFARDGLRDDAAVLVVRSETAHVTPQNEG